MVEHGVPGSLLRIIFKSVEEHLGEKGLRLLLTQAKMTEFLENPPPDIDTPV